MWCVHAHNEVAGAGAVAPPTPEEFEDMITRHYRIVNPKPKPPAPKPERRQPAIFAKIEGKRRGR